MIDDTTQRLAKCPNCGSPIPGAAAFCMTCGHALGQKPAPAWVGQPNAPIAPPPGYGQPRAYSVPPGAPIAPPPRYSQPPAYLPQGYGPPPPYQQPPPMPLPTYGDTLMASGEHVLYRGRQHWAALVPELFWDGVALVLGVLVVTLIEVVAMHVTNVLVAVLLPAAVVALGILSMVVSYQSWKNREYLVTNDRVLGVRGLLGKKTLDVSLDKITNVELSQSRIARLFKLGYGNIDIRTAHEGSVAVYSGLIEVVAFKKAVLDARNALWVEAPEAASAAIPAAPIDSSAMAKTPDEIMSALTRLADLRDRGAITQPEFEAKKSEMLARL
jgi:membrane protein YdbS with pleckstrin-like domain